MATPEQKFNFLQKLTHSKVERVFSADKRNLTESELAAFVNYKGGLAITDLILEQLHRLPDYLAVEAFFRFEDLLGNATLFFLHEIFRRDQRTQETIAALQRENLLLDVREPLKINSSRAYKNNWMINRRVP